MYFFSLVVGLGFQVYIAYRYGASRAVDIFIFSSALVLFFTASFSTGLTGSFVPMFTEKQHRSPEGAWAFSGKTLVWTFALTTAVSGILVVFALPVLRLVANGDGGIITPEDVSLLRWQALSIPFVVISQLLILILNCVSKYILSTLSTLLNSCGILLFAFLFAPLGASSLGIGIFIASLAQCGFLFALCAPEFDLLGRDKARYRPGKADNSDIWSMFARVSVLAGMFMLFKGSDVFDRYLSLSLGPGYTSYIGYSYRILIAGGNLLSVGLLTTSYPEISKAVARNELAAVRATINKVIRLLFLFMVPVTMWIFGVGDVAISFLFQHGKFGGTASAMVFTTLKMQIGLLWFPALASFFTSALYSYREISKVAFIGIFATCFSVAVKILLLKQFGYFGLVLSVTLCYLLDTLVLYRAALIPIGGLSVVPALRENAVLLVLAACLVALSLLAGEFLTSVFIRVGLLLVATVAYAALLLRSGLLPTSLFSRRGRAVSNWFQST
jgi:putative peptidoglycan lipid II flippase